MNGVGVLKQSVLFSGNPVLRRARVFFFAACLILFQHSLFAGTVSWIGGNGDWNTLGNWSGNGLPGTNDDVVINPPGGPFTITHSAGTHTVHSLLSQQAFTLSGGSLTVSNTVQVNNTFILSSGTLISATVLQSTNGSWFSVHGSGTLSAVTMDENLDVGSSVNTTLLTVSNGLVLNGTASVGNPTNDFFVGAIDFVGSQTLGGAGTVIFGDNNGFYSSALYLGQAGTTLTIGANITIDGQYGVIGSDNGAYWGGPTNVSVVNLGIISCNVSGGTITINAQPFNNQSLAEGINGGSLTINVLQNSNDGAVTLNGAGSLALNGAWNNAGAINATNATVNLGGTFAPANIGVVNRSGGTVNLTGVLTNTALTLNAASGSWKLAGGTVLGGTITESGGADMIVSSGTLNGVTVSGTLDVGNSINGTVLTVTNGLTLNGTILLGNPTNISFVGAIDFAGSQTLGGSGTVIVGDNNGSATSALYLGLAGTTLTIGPGITIDGQNGLIGSGASSFWGGPANVSVINLGIISCNVSGGTITINAQPFNNQALAEGINGGSLTINVLQNNSDGAVTLNGAGSLALNGAWNNAGAINATNATVNLGGTFAPANIGVVNRSGGTVNLTGVLTNTALTLNAASGSWKLAGGTVLGGTITESGGADMIVSSGTLNGVTVSGTLDVGNSINGTVLTVTNGLTLNGTILLGNPTNISFVGAIDFAGSQTLGGSGTVIVGDNNGSATSALYLGLAGTTLTIGPGITIDGQNGLIGSGASSFWGGPANVSVINLGIISCNVSGGTITINAQPFNNQALAEGINGGSLTINVLQNSNDGAVTLNGAGSLALNGAWNNAGAINATNATVNLGGTFAGGNVGVFNRSGGTIDLTGTLTNTGSTLTLNAASGSWKLAGGTVLGGTITESGGADMIVSSGTLNGVTVSGTLDVGNSINGTVLTVTNGLTLNGTILLGNPTNISFVGAIDFAGSQTLGGSGTVIVGDNNGSATSALYLGLAGTTLTIGPGITIDGQNGLIGSGASSFWGGPANVSVINLGIISCNVSGGTITINAQPFNNQALAEGINGGTVLISGALNNTGTLLEINGGLSFPGALTTAQLGNVLATNGSVLLTGTLNNSNATLAFNPGSGPWVLQGGTVLGGTISGGNTAELIVHSSGTLNGVTVDVNMDVGDSVNSTILTVTNGLALNGTMSLGNPTNVSFVGAVNFTGTQMLGGGGTVVFGQNSGSAASALFLGEAGTALTIGSGITIEGASGAVGSDNGFYWGGPTNVSVVNLGTISCNVNGGTIRVNGLPFDNQGLAEGINGGTLATLGALNNMGELVESNGALNLGGAFTTAALGTVNATNGFVYLSGVLTNTAAALAFGAQSGPWVLEGGTILGGTITGNASAGLIVEGSGTLNGVTLNGTLDVGGTYIDANLTVTNGLVLNGTASVGNPTNTAYGAISFAGSQALGGNGTVIFGDQLPTSLDALRLTVGATTLTLGPGITVQGENGTLGYSSYWGGPQNVSIINQGTIACAVPSGTFAITAQSGGFNNQGALSVGLSGASGYGQIQISGSVALSGILNVFFTGGYVPALSNSFAVITYGSHSGSFAAVNLPLAPVWQASYGATALNIVVADINKLAFTTQPAGTNAGSILLPVVVQVEDSVTGNLIATNGAPVTISIANGSGTVSGTLTRNTDANGRATFNDIAFNLVGQKMLQASAPVAEFTPSISASFTIQPGPPAQLALTSPISSPQPSANLFSAPPVVQVLDRFGNVVPTSTAPITAALVSSPGGTLGGTTTANPDGYDGKAAFTNLYYELIHPPVSETAVIYYSSPGLTPVTNGPITIDYALTSILLTNNNSQAMIDPTSDVGLFSWTVDGVNQVFQHWFWLYDGQFASQLSIDQYGIPMALSYTSSNVSFVYISQRLTVNLQFTLEGGAPGSFSSDIIESITLQNTNSFAFDTTLYSYADFDLAGISTGDTVSFPATNSVLQAGKSLSLAEIIQPNPTFREASWYSITLDKLEENPNVSLADSITPQAPGDQTFAYQWNLVVLPGQTVTVTLTNSVRSEQVSLNIAVAGGNAVVSWPTNVIAGTQLQTTSALGGADWTVVTNSPAIVNGQYQVTLPVTAGAQFYRLIQ